MQERHLVVNHRYATSAVKLSSERTRVKGGVVREMRCGAGRRLKQKPPRQNIPRQIAKVLVLSVQLESAGKNNCR